jgi:hemerythrin
VPEREELEMALIEWSSDLSVNVSEIDAQHQRLITLINQLNDAMKQGKGKDVLGKTIGDLFSYAGSHFAKEEEYFTRFKYPEAATHKGKHAEFIKKISEFKEGYDQGRLALTLEIMNFLKDWLRNHIQGVDKRYSPLFNANGLK